MARLNWRGDEVKRTVMANAEQIISDILLEVEGEAKKQLYRGHGVETGTLRRDIHSEGPEKSGKRVRGRVGAWVDYALAVHQGHHDFEGYHYITNGVDIVRSRVMSIVARYRIKR